MTQSLYEALAEVMGIVGVVHKDSKNEFHGYKYASAESVLRKVNEEVSKRGICVGSFSELLSFENGVAVVRITLTFTKGGLDPIRMTGIGAGSDKGDKAVMKANTAAIKYALASGFLIAWSNEDPEADSATDKQETREDLNAVLSAVLTKLRTADNLNGLDLAKTEASALPSKYKLTKTQTAQMKTAYLERKKALGG